MKKLRIILLLSVVIFIRVFYITNNDIYKTKYSIDNTNIEGYINDYKINPNYLQIELVGKEKVLVNYYFKDVKEIKNINYKLGDYLYIKGKFKYPSNNTNFNLFNYNKYLKSKKIYFIFTATDIIKKDSTNKINYKIKNIIINRIKKINNNYLYTFILGNTFYLDSDIKLSYRNNGISHLFAISGMHITFLSTFLLKILEKILKNKYIINIIVFSFLIFYMFLTNFSPSVIRATLLFISLSINSLFKLKLKPIICVLLILDIMLLYNPYYIYNIGFLLSFVVSISLIVFGKIINNYKNYFVKIFVVSLISFLISIPIMINNNNEINLLSPIINVIFVPYISLIMFPISLIAFLIPLLNPILEYIIKIGEFTSIFIDKIGFKIILKEMNIILFIPYYLLIIYVISKLKDRKYTYLLLILITLVIHSNINYLNKYPIITMIDVGQGDSILVELPYNKGNILIDTGGIVNYNNNTNYSIADSIIIPYLKSIGIKRLDYLVLTHGDYDHMGEAISLVNNFKVNYILMNSGNNNYLEKKLIKNTNVKYKNISKYDLKIDKYLFKFINDKNIKNENEDSLITYTKLNNFNILFMGDAGEISEKYILDTYNIKNMDILKVGHHGSKNSSKDFFIKNIKPKYALISSGKNNRFNHPNKEVINILNKYNTKYFITSINGMIRLVLKDTIYIYTCL